MNISPNVLQEHDMENSQQYTSVVQINKKTITGFENGAETPFRLAVTKATAFFCCIVL